MAKKRASKPHELRVKAVLFDLDGTLIHSAIDFLKLKRETIDFLTGKGLSSESFSSEIKTYDIMQLALILFKEKGFLEQDFVEISANVEGIWNRVELESVGKATPIKGVKRTLLELRERGVRIGVVTRGCREYAVESLKATCLFDMVDVIVGRGDTPQPKPSPEPLRKAIKMLGLRNGEVVMVGDNTDDWQCARSAKVCFIGVVSRLSKGEIFKDSMCKVVLDDLRELLDILY